MEFTRKVSDTTTVRSGLKANLAQFVLLVVVNAFVGGMLGMERSVFPELADKEFGVKGYSALLSFIIAFGISKAISNYIAGRYAGRFGRRNLLISGWILAFPVPLILMYANSWSWIVFANVLMGIHQGFAWSMTVVMKVDLAGKENRGLAMGLNEFAGYIALSLVAMLTGYIASVYGIRPYPFYTGLILGAAGLILSIFFVKDTASHVIQENKTGTAEGMRNVFVETSFRNKNLSAVTQAGFVNNLNDGMVWGLLPVLLAIRGFEAHSIALIAGVYPAVWGLSQLLTGPLGDRFRKKNLIALGMLMQAIALFLYAEAYSIEAYISLSIILGLGTALVYPNFLSAIAEDTMPEQRAEAIGVFRLWRDLGYAAGALITGIIADRLGVIPAILVIAGITLISGFIVYFRMQISAEECIEVQALKNKLGRKDVLIVDVREQHEYSNDHIPLAVNIPLNTISEHFAELRNYKEIITVCTGGAGRSARAANYLRSNGFRNSKWLCGGTVAWT
jgi:MFS family permease